MWDGIPIYRVSNKITNLFFKEITSTVKQVIKKKKTMKAWFMCIDFSLNNDMVGR